jgi:hypothetical protein
LIAGHRPLSINQNAVRGQQEVAAALAPRLTDAVLR